MDLIAIYKLLKEGGLDPPTIILLAFCAYIAKRAFDMVEGKNGNDHNNSDGKRRK